MELFWVNKYALLGCSIASSGDVLNQQGTPTFHVKKTTLSLRRSRCSICKLPMHVMLAMGFFFCLCNNDPDRQNDQRSVLPENVFIDYLSCLRVQIINFFPTYFIIIRQLLFNTQFSTMFLNLRVKRQIQQAGYLSPLILGLCIVFLITHP